MKLEKWTWKIVSIEASSSNRDNRDGKIKCLITFAGMKPRLIFLHANFSLFSFLDPPQDIERIILIISWKIRNVKIYSNTDATTVQWRWLDRLIKEGEPKGAAKEIHMVW